MQQTTSRSKIKDWFLELWKHQMKQYSEGKLRTYTTFKVHFGFENYLSVIGNFEHRRCLTKLLEKQQIAILWAVSVTRPLLEELTIYHIRVEHGNHYTTDFIMYIICMY
jgi:hypothetical protein